MNPIYLDLAPADLQIYRNARYDGGGFHINLQELAAEDINRITTMYNMVKGIYDLWMYMGATPNYPLLRKQLDRFATNEFLTSVQAIGTATQNIGRASEEIRHALHDLRGGALTALTGYARLLPMLSDNVEVLRQAVYLARDHAKMIRNIVPDLDPAVREADEGTKLHRIDEFVQKWDGFKFELPDKNVTVVAETHFAGYVTSRCLETSAVDRILYNYVNNAARFTASGKVQLTVIPAGAGVVRWVIANDITPDQQSWLLENVGEDLSKLFQGGYTRGGNGIGLSNCAQFVSTSFGLDSAGEALQKGYLGAKVVDLVYYAWFHWPAYIPQDENEPECDCGEH